MSTASGQVSGKQQGSATVQYSMYTQSNEAFVGRTVAEVRNAMAEHWGIPSDSDALKGKTRLPEDYIIQAGDNVQFHRRSGEKG